MCKFPQIWFIYEMKKNGLGDCRICMCLHDDDDDNVLVDGENVVIDHDGDDNVEYDGDYKGDDDEGDGR